MPKDSDKSKSDQQKPEPERKSSQQYEMLKRCSEKKDMTEWNKWREEHRDEIILLGRAHLKYAHLQDANLVGANLQGANLVEAHLQGAELGHADLQHADLYGAYLQSAELGHADLQHADLTGARLQDADLRGANLQGANLRSANLQGADLWVANLQGADLRTANLQGANLVDANLQGAELVGANLHGANLWAANLHGANLVGANLHGANLVEAHLQGANLLGASLQDANFTIAIFDGSTLIWDCKVGRKTNFKGVGLDSARIEPETIQLLKYNIRRMNWQEWYKEHRLLRWPARWFWHLSNYGMSTGRIIGWFFGLAFFFAAIYSNWAYWFPPGVVNDLFIESEMPQQISLTSCFLVYFFRPIYFSVVTMTTLGFGDMYARAWSWPGHVLLMTQVILGYVLLAALVTRFAVLFTAGGPAGKFAKEYKKPKGEQEK